MAGPREEAAFFQMVHELLERHGQEKSLNQRRHERWQFPQVQLAAACLGGELPTLEGFREIRCFDLSAAGFSYLAKASPATGELVVALGSPPRRTLLAAEVVHDTPMRLIGCRFTGRMDADPHASQASIILPES